MNPLISASRLARIERVRNELNVHGRPVCYTPERCRLVLERQARRSVVAPRRAQCSNEATPKRDSFAEQRLRSSGLGQIASVMSDFFILSIAKLTMRKRSELSTS